MTRPNSDSIILESPATVHYEYRGEDNVEDGTLYLLTNRDVQFWTRHLFRDERHHYYGPAEILDVASNADGFTVNVVCPATDDEDEEIVRYFYEMDKEETERWVRALTRPSEMILSSFTSPKSPPVVVREIREREIIREIVKVKCSHCGYLFDQKEDRCPHCGGR